MSSLTLYFRKYKLPAAVTDILNLFLISHTHTHTEAVSKFRGCVLRRSSLSASPILPQFEGAVQWILLSPPYPIMHCWLTGVFFLLVMEDEARETSTVLITICQYKILKLSSGCVAFMFNKRVFILFLSLTKRVNTEK